MDKLNRILACIDASIYANSVVDHACWAAARVTAAIEVLHVIQRNDAVQARTDLSGAVGLGAKSALLEELARIDESAGKAAQHQGRVLLDAARDHIVAAGHLPPTITHRHGGIVETIVDREREADIVVIGKRGASADFAKGHLGSKVERVIRQSNKPVLVASRAFREPTSVVVAYDGGKSSRIALSFTAGEPLFAGLGLHVIMAGKDDVENRRHMDDARAKVGERTSSSFTLVDGKPEQVIGDQLIRHGSEMLVMGAYGHSPLRSMFVGSTTSEMIRLCTVPVLLFR